MMKINKGALAMVLAGSVTFSAIAALVTEQSSKQSAEENALTISGDRKTADVIAENTVKDQTPTTNVKDIQQNKEELSKITTIHSANAEPTTTTTTAAATVIAASEKALKTMTTTLPAKSTTSETTTPVPATTGTNTASEAASTLPVMTGTNNEVITPTIPATTGANRTSEVSTTKTAATGTNTTNETTTTTTTASTTNHGQTVSQAVKERALSRQDKKENNGKKF